MHHKLYLLVIALVIAFSGCTPTEDQQSLDQTNISPESLSNSVRDEFLRCWQAYKENAWGHDELLPISGKYRDWHSSPLMITAVDALDFLLILGMDDEANETIEFLSGNLNFDVDVTVKNFEITIRVLGGLVSSYQLSSDQRLLDLANELAERLLPVFDSPTGMPYMFVNLKTGETSGPVSNPAEIATLMLEFGALARLTGNSDFYDKPKKAVSTLFDLRSQIDLIGEQINVETGEWVDGSSHLGGRIDSYYEYLYKSYLLFEDADFKEMFDLHMSAINTYLKDPTEKGLWYGQVNMNSGEMIAQRWGALEAFFPGLLAMTGDIENAVALQDTCFMLWTTFGIEPESFDYGSFKILNPIYVLRPEIIESAWYLHTATGEEKYIEMGKVFFNSLLEKCKSEYGFAELVNVETGEQRDRMESFFLTETLKYLYFLFSGESKIDLGKSVFTTEAHPLFRSW